MVWNLFPFKSDFSLGKSQKPQDAKSGLQWGWVTRVIWCFSKKLCMSWDAWAGMLLWWATGCPSPVACSCGFLNDPNSFCGGMFKFNAKLMHIHCCTCSVILNVMATQYTCSLSGVYNPPWLVQWSHHCSCMRIPIQSPGLTGYINVTQSVIIILTVAGLFPDIPHISFFICSSILWGKFCYPQGINFCRNTFGLINLCWWILKIKKSADCYIAICWYFW